MKICWQISLCSVLTAAFAAGAGVDRPTSPRERPQIAERAHRRVEGTSQPEGTRRDKQSGFWTEDLAWSWHFKGDEAWLGVTIDQGKHFASGELRFVPDKDFYRLSLKSIDGSTQTFEGRLKDKVLTLDREDAAAKETQRLVFTFLHDNRFLYRMDMKPAGRTAFTKVTRSGATKKGVAFAAGETR